MQPTIPTLILVYNADGGVLDALGDFVHKIVSPATYPCSLCGLTYGAFTMRGAWRRFLDTLGLTVLFLYRDEFRSELDQRGIALPAILFGDKASAPEVLVSADELNALPDLAALMALVKERLASVSA